MRGLAPLGYFPILVPEHHLPVHGLAGDERLASVWHPRRFVGVDLAAVPKVGLVGQQFRLAGGDDAEGGLRLLVTVRRKLP